MNRFTTRLVCTVSLVLLALSARAAAQPMPFEDVVRNLTNADPKVRVSAVRLLQEARYPESVVPLAALVNDPVDGIQLETMAAELSFFLVDPEPARPRSRGFVDLGLEGAGPAAFELGPLAAWPRPAPPELVAALLQALNDSHKGVRLEAIYTLGVLARPPLGDEAAGQLIKALEHPDPVVRAGAARVIGRLAVSSAADALFKAINDGKAEVRYAAMSALGDVRDPRAVQSLTEQFNYYGKGPGAVAALDALARIGHPSSVGLFKASLSSKDPALRRAAAEGLGRAGAKAEVESLQIDSTMDESNPVRAAVAFALLKLGLNFTARLLDFLETESTARQVQAYLIELGPPMVPSLLPRLLEPEKATRKYLAEVLGVIGDRQAADALSPLTKDDDDTVAAAATTAIERIKMRH
jgi:HEAT repeat protein